MRNKIISLILVSHICLCSCYKDDSSSNSVKESEISKDISASSDEANAEEESYDDLSGYTDLPKVADGFIPWERFLRRDKALKTLSGTKVKVQGFMFPLDQSDKQAHFLLSVYPPSCGFCLPAGPDGLIDVNLTKPIEFVDGQVKVEGIIDFPKLEEIGLLYRVTEGNKLE